MWKAEEDFPRGGGSQRVRKDVPDNENQENFPKNNVKAQGKEIQKLKKRKLSTTDDKVEQRPTKRAKKKSEGNKSAVIPSPLHDALNPGVCVLGCVHRSYEYSISISLPGQLSAQLPITEVSPAYTQLLQTLANADDPSSVEEISPVETLFQPGMMLPVKVTDILDGKYRGKQIIKVSSSPMAVNSDLPVKAVKNGQLLFGSVSSIEDHGYRIDLGIKGLQAFLVTRDAENFVKRCGCSLRVGQPIWCVLKAADDAGVRAGQTRVVNVTIDPEMILNSQLPETTNLDSLRPGMTVPAIVQSVSGNGLNVNVFKFTGTIHSSQLGKGSNQYSPGEQILAKILYVNPSTKELQLTNLTQHMKFDGTANDPFKDIKIGDFADAKVSRVQKGKGVYFLLPQKLKGFAAISHLNDNEKTAQDLTEFQKGQQHRCRIMGFNYMEAVTLISLKQSVLEQKFLSLADISVGEILEVLVEAITLNGLVVKISKGIFSFIPCMHLADVPLKHPEKKFEVGQKVKCRVLKVDLDKSKVLLTLKKSLVKLKSPVLSDYSQLRPYMELEGYIIAVKDNVVVVAFFNGVQGYVTLKDMSTEKVEDPSALFYKGQVIRCRVVHFNVDDKKLKLSFNFGEKKELQEKSNEDDLFELGKIVKARVLREDKFGFRLQLLPSQAPALLPWSHLSDFQEVQDVLKLAIKPRQTIDRVTFFSKKNTTHKIVTKKECLLQAAEDKVFVNNFEDMSTGILLPAVIKNHQEYGMFLEIAGGHTGLCPAKTMTSVQPASLSSVFPCGQSVVTRVTRIDTEKQRFLGSVRLDETYEGGLDSSLRQLQHFLKAKEEASALLYAERDELSVYGELNVGSVTEITVTSVLKKGILGELPSGANALATKQQFGGIEPSVGSTYTAVILYVDPLTPCVELTIEPKIVKAVTSLKDNTKNKVRPGQCLKADVLLVKTQFMLMCARGHAQGRLLYVPTKKHINDVDLNKPYKPGTFTEIVVKEECDGYQMAVLRSQDPDAAKKKGLDLNNMKEHDLKPGTVVDAKIRAVHPLQLNIEVGKVHGRVHITEVDDNPKEGINPLSQFKQGHTIKVVVIGLRDVKSESYLPISHPKAKRSLLECSLKRSKLQNPEDERNLIPKFDIKESQEVTGFVISASPQKVWLQLSLTQQGYVDQFHLTDDVEHVSSLKFKPGQPCTATVTGVQGENKLELSFIGKKHVIEVDSELPALITSLKPESSIHVKLPNGHPGIVREKPNVLHYTGQLIMVKIDKMEGLDVYLLSLVDMSRPAILRKHRKRKTSINEEETMLQAREKIAQKKKLKMEKKLKERKESESKVSDDEVDLASEPTGSVIEEDKSPTAKQIGTQPRLSVAGFSWGGDILPDGLKVQEQDDGDDEDDVPIDSKTKKKRKRDEEKLIQEYERNQLEGNTIPETPQEFERLTLQSPNSSLVWLRYMAFHAGLGEMEKARAVAERALTTISFREEQEKKNVWLAYLNLETSYGDPADVKKLLERAVTYNDPLDIYLKMCDIYAGANKIEDAEQLYTVMTRKYKRDKSVWKAYGQFLFKAGRTHSARNLLQRCTSLLDKRDHVEVISKFATLEFSQGDAERGRTMFENLIASYPGRTDLWSVYVDQVVRVGDITGARDILDRAVKQKFSSKRLSFLIQKMIRFEEKHGTDEQVQKVKDMALTLLES